MLFDPSTADHLRPWLTRTLEPICDADPEALSNYILALLKHDAPESELRTELTSQLEEFLEKEGPPFIDTLFTVLRTKTYLPYADADPPSATTSATPTTSTDNGIPIPLDALLSPSIPPPSDRGRKRPSEYDGEGGRPAKGPRLNSDERFRHGGGPSNGGAWDGGMGGMGMGMGMGGMNGMNGGMPGMMNGRGGHQYQPPARGRGICRDYHNNGYCSRGAFCKYSHGDDAFVPMLPMNGQFGPMFNGMGMFPMGPGGGDVAYDPHEARMELQPQIGMGVGVGARPPRLQRNADGTRGQGELPVIQDLTPRDALGGSPSGNNGGSGPVAGPSREGMLDSGTPQNGMPFNGGMDVDMGGPPMRGGPRGGGGGFRGRGRGGGGRPGTFNGDVQNFRPERRNDKTLVVEKIPSDKLSLEDVNGWFKKFGTVTNVAIDAKGAKALVSFAEHEHAHAAWKSEEAVFGNRFVKVFWHRPMEGHGQVGQRALAASAPVVAGLGTQEAGGSGLPASGSTGTSAGENGLRASSSNPAMAALAEKQRKLEQFISEQKDLMGRLKTASADEKKGIFARLRELGKEIEQTKSDGPAAAASSTPAAPKRPTPTTATPSVEASQRDLLDKELELHSAAAADGDEETTEGLKAKLAKLKAEAASLGIDPNSAEPMYPPRGGSPYRPYRGRGRARGRGGFRGAMRGGPPPTNRRLDNRPRKLLVKDVGPDVEQAVRDWYDATGQAEAFETLEGGDFVVTFRTRAAAEQGLAKGANIPLAGQKQISWYAPASSASVSTSRKVAPGDLSVASDHTMENDAERLGEEDVGPSGWGGDDADDGMGLL